MKLEFDTLAKPLIKTAPPPISLERAELLMKLQLFTTQPPLNKIAPAQFAEL